MNNRKINIDLYGDGSRSAKLRAEVIYCDRCDECSLYQRGLCCKVTTFLCPSCPIGSKSSYGYHTKQSKAYHTLYNETKADECYHKLDYPSNMCLETVGDDVLLRLSFADTSYKDDMFTINNPGFGSQILCISKDVLTNDILKRICSFIPRNWGNTEIKDYQVKIVPDFVNDLRIKLPNIYKRFIEEYPEYDIKPNYVGKRAKLNTVNKTLTYHTKHYGDFHFEWINCEWQIVFEDYNSAFIPFNGKHARLHFKLTEEMEIEITDNEQVIEETVFV